MTTTETTIRTETATYELAPRERVTVWRRCSGCLCTFGISSHWRDEDVWERTKDRWGASYVGSLNLYHRKCVA